MYTRAILLAAGAVCLSVALPALAGPQGGNDVLECFFPLTVSQEVPTPTIPGLEPAGVGHVTYAPDTNLLAWVITYAGLTGPATAAHFHGPAGLGQTAPPLVFAIGGDSGVPSPQPASGVVVGSKILTDTQETDLFNGLWYFNIHTALNPPGEIRGQIQCIPEPATLGLVALGGVLLLRRQRR